MEAEREKSEAEIKARIESYETTMTEERNKMCRIASSPDGLASIFRRDYIFEMHEAVQEAHQKFSSDLEMQNESHRQEKECMMNEIAELNHQVEQLEGTIRTKTTVIGELNDQVESSCVLFCSLF